MPMVRFTTALNRFFPELREDTFHGRTVAEIVAAADRRHPGLADYLVDERGALRKHVNIFIGNVLIRDREQLTDALADDDRVSIFQALSGG